MPGEKNSQTMLAEIEQLLASYKESLKKKRWMKLGIFSPKRLLCEVEIAESILASDSEDTVKIANLRAWAGAQGARFINFASDDARELRKGIFNAADILPKLYAEDHNEEKARQKPESFIAKMKSRIKKKRWFKKKNFFDRYSERITDLEYTIDESLDNEVAEKVIDSVVYDISEEALKIAQKHDFEEEANVFSETLNIHEKANNEILDNEILNSISSSIDEYSNSRHFQVSTKLSFELKNQSKMINRLLKVVLNEIKILKNNTPTSIDSVLNQWKVLYSKEYKKIKIHEYTQAGCARPYYRASIERAALLLNDLEGCINSIISNLHYLLTLQEMPISKAEFYVLLSKYQSTIVALFNELLEAEYSLDHPEDPRLAEFDNWAYQRLNNQKPIISNVELSENDSDIVREEKLNRQSCNNLLLIQRALWDLRPVFDNFINEGDGFSSDYFINSNNIVWDKFRLIDNDFSAVEDLAPYARENNLVSYRDRSPNSFWFLALIAYLPKLLNNCIGIVQNKRLEQLSNIQLLTYRSPMSAFMYSNELGISDEITVLNEVNRTEFYNHLKTKSPSFNEIRQVIKSIPINVLIEGSQKIGSKLATSILLLFYSGLDPVICLPDVFNNKESSQCEYFIKMTLANILLHSIRYSYGYWGYLYASCNSGLYQRILAISNIIYTFISNDEIVSTLSHAKKIYDINSCNDDVEVVVEIVATVKNCLEEFGIFEVEDQEIMRKTKEIYPWDISEELTLSKLNQEFFNPIDWVNRVLKFLKKVGKHNCYNELKSQMDSIQRKFNTFNAFKNKKMFSHEMEEGFIEYAFSTRSDSFFLTDLDALKTSLSLLSNDSCDVDFFIEGNLTSIPFTLRDLEDEFLNGLHVINNGLKELGSLHALLLNLISEQSIPVNRIEKNSTAANQATENAVECIREEEKRQIEDHKWFFFLCPCTNIPIDDDDEEYIPPVNS